MKKYIVICFMFLSLLTFSKENYKIVTSNQLAYTIASRLTENTDVSVVSAFDVYTDMFNQKISFRDLTNKDEIFKNVDAVVTLSKTLEDDFLYEEARRHKISVIDIDLTYSYRELSSLVLSRNLDENNKGKDYLWLDFSNLYKMIDIAKLDLIDIYPKYNEQIKKNAKKFKKEISDIYNEYMQKVLKKKTDLAVIQIGENQLDYLLNSLEIYSENLPYSSTKEEIKEMIDKTGINKIVSIKTLKKDKKIFRFNKC